MQSEKVVYLAEARPDNRKVEYAVFFAHVGAAISFKIFGADNKDRRVIADALIRAGERLKEMG